MDQNKPAFVSIYYLVDPTQPDDVRYVGKTWLTLQQRLRSHVNGSKYRKSYSANWIKSLKQKGLKPSIVLIENVTFDDWERAEMKWIQFYKDAGALLTNHAIGGSGVFGFKHSEAHKASMRRPNKKVRIRKYETKEERYTAHSKFLKNAYKNGLLKPSIPSAETVAKAVKSSLLVSEKPVYELDGKGNLVNRFRSVAECSRITGLVGSNIARVCRGKSKHTGKRYFTYALFGPNFKKRATSEKS